MCTNICFPPLYVSDDLVLCGESEGDLRVIVGCFIGVNAGKSKVIVMLCYVMLECEVCVNGYV